ncbi:MAG TPA: TetR/AcrR family transcriptional regulator, partial [Hyphomicrobiaceae bacterium]|nr:TetR/AcrR family transcriptional regulator [Hyphomicrobiaceae bacterium]
MPGPEYRERLKAETIAIARRILEAEGLSALQARRVAKEAGCSVGTIYNLYSNLDDLIVVANAGTLENLGVELGSTLAAHESVDFEGRMVALGLSYLSFAVQNEKAWRAVFEHHLDADQSVPDWYRDRQSDLFD